MPSVVSIDTVGERRERLNYLGKTYERTWETNGIGSGVIVTPEGHVVTNEHVINGTLGMKVTLHDGRTFPARLIGKDPTLDVAVLRIDGEGPFRSAQVWGLRAGATGGDGFCGGQSFRIWVRR